MSKKEELLLETYKLIEIYKAGFLDGYKIAKGINPEWKRISKKCSKMFKKRLDGAKK